jgi:hypothetical protein
MGYESVITVERSYIRVELSGERERGREAEDSLRVWEEVIQILKESGIHAILAVLNLDGRLPTMAGYQIATTLDTIGIPRRTRIALVDLNSDSRPDNEFAATVAVNRGYMARIFSSEEDALKWLLENNKS